MILTDFIKLVQFYKPKSTLILTPVYKIIFFQYKLGLSFKNLTNWQTNKSNDKDIDSSDLTCGCVGCIAFVMKTAVNCHYNCLNATEKCGKCRYKVYTKNV